MASRAGLPRYLNYYFWLVAVSLFFLVLESIKPWHKEQEVIRERFVQYLFWLVFNQQYLAWILAIGVVKIVKVVDGTLASIRRNESISYRPCGDGSFTQSYENKKSRSD
jgi:hypothetical protein